MNRVKFMQRRTGDQLVDPRFVKAISHPIRVEIIAAATLAPISQSEFREQAQRSYSKQVIAHHFAALCECDAIEEVDSRTVSGGRERFYRPKSRAFFSDEDFERLPPALRGHLTATVLTTFMQRAEESLMANTLDSDPARHAWWMPLELDAEGFRELNEKGDEMYYWLRGLQRRANDRRAASGEKVKDVTAALFSFESPPPVRRRRL